MKETTLNLKRVITCEKSVFDRAGLVSTNARTKCVIQLTGGDGGATGS